MPDPQERFQDPAARLWNFADHILVRCPRCQGRATVAGRPAPDHHAVARLTAPHRLTCPGCGHAAEWRPRPWTRGTGDPYFTRGGPLLVPRMTGPDDPFFGRPLWLQRPCRGHVLWAYNERHLDVLEAYVAARLRERGRWTGSGSMLEHLPAWIKAAANRQEVLKALRAMRADLP